MPLLLLVCAALAAEPEPALADDSWRRLYLEATLPDPGVATSQSLFIGFGAGHFYAHDRRGGFTHLAVQGGGALVVGAGVTVFLMSYEGYRYPEEPGLVMIGAGATALVVGRIIDVFTAPRAAHRYAAEQISEQGADR